MIEDELLKNAVKLIETNSTNCYNLESFKWKNDLYKIQNFVKIHLKNSTEKHTNFIGQLLSAHLIKDYPKTGVSFAVVHVQYYFDRHSISDAHKPFKTQLSENELFKSNLFTYIPLNYLNGKTKIVTLQAYFDNPDEHNLLFSQAEYNTKRDKIIPALSGRAKICFCQTIENPDFNYIMCELCKNWFHYQCVGISDTNNEDLSMNFYCKNCHV